MMAWLGDHALIILAGYAVVIPVLLGLVWLSLRRARIVRQQMREAETDG